ncbi:hypothetical protein FRB98_004262 [Tulasnella sp. 332]|nr:hypothetical protein FRB98_004262 [Tulasnella sp. 332]
MLDCSWCPVCENLIPPERTTITLPPLVQPLPVNAPESIPPPPPPVTRAGGRGGKAGGTAAGGGRRPPGLNRHNSKITSAATGRKATGNAAITNSTDQIDLATVATAAAADSQPTGPVRHRIIISQDPTPLYCSEACRLKDTAIIATTNYGAFNNNSQVLSQPNLQAYGAGYKPPFAVNGHGASQQRLYHNNGDAPPFAVDNGRSDHRHNQAHGRNNGDQGGAAHPNNSARKSSATATTTSTATASSDSIASFSSTSVDHPPPGLKMTSLVSDLNNVGKTSGSAPATMTATDIDSQLLNGSNGLLPRNVKLDLDRWHNLPTNSTSTANTSTNPPTHPSRNGSGNGLGQAQRQSSAYDLYKSTYPLAFETTRTGGSRHEESARRRSSSRHTSNHRNQTTSHQSSRRNSSHLGYNWGILEGNPDGVDVTPTQSLLITKTPARRDDSFDPPSLLRTRSSRPASSHGGSDSGSTTSERSESARSERKPPPLSRRRSSRMSSHSKHHGSDAGSESAGHPPRPPDLSRSASCSSRSHGSPSSYRSNNSFLRNGGNPHPLSSSFSARDIIEQAQERERLKSAGGEAGVVKTSVPVGSVGSRRSARSGSAHSGKENANGWQRRGSGFTAIEEPASLLMKPSPPPTPVKVDTVSEEIESTDNSPRVRSSIKALNAAPAISTSSSSATIVASAFLPSSSPNNNTRSGGSPSSSPSVASTIGSSSKRNSSFANLAGMAASLFGFGGFGGLTMTKSGVPPPSSGADVPDKGIQPTTGTKGSATITSNSVEDPALTSATEEPARGRSRASSRASRTTNEMLATTINGNGGTSTVTTTPGTTPASHSIVKGEMEMVPARRPLGPLPKDLSEKSKSVSRDVRERSEEERKREKREKRMSTSRLVLDVVGIPAGGFGGGLPTAVSTSTSHTSNTSRSTTSAWDPDLVRDIKERRKLSHEATYFSQHPSPFNASPSASPTSPILPRRQRTTSSQSRHSKSSHSHSHSHSRSNSYSQQRHQDAVQEEEGGDEPPRTDQLPRTQSMQSMLSNGSQHRQHPHGSLYQHRREPPSPTTSRYPPKGLSMTSLSTYGQSGKQQPPLGMYAAPNPPLARTTSQPYVARWMSASPTHQPSGGSTSPAKDGYHTYEYPGSTADAHQYQQVSAGMQRRDSNTKPTGPTYPVLNLPVGTRKKKVWKKKTNADGTEEDVLTDGEEEEEVFEKRKRLFYFDR